MCSKIAAYEYSDCTPLNKDRAPLPDSSMPSPRLLVVGRTPNGKKISAEKAGVAVTDRGFINVDIPNGTDTASFPKQ